MLKLARKDWKTKPLGELLDVQNGYAFASEQFTKNGGMPLIRIRDLRGGRETEIRFEGEFDEKFIVKSEDLLIGMDGEFRCYKWQGADALLNQRVCRLIDFSDEVLPEFVFYGVNSHLKVIEDKTPFVTVRHLSAKKVKEIHFEYPSLTEQRRIVTRIKECMERVEELEQLRAEAMQEAIGIYPSRCHDYFAPNEQTKKWGSVSIGELAAFIQYGYTQSSTKAPIGPQFLRITDIQNHTVNWDSVPYCEADAKQTAKYKLAKNDILFARTGATTGKSFLIENEPPLSVFASYLIRLQLNQTQVLPRLIYHFFQSPLYWDQIHQNMRGGAQPNINSKVLASIKLTIPEDLEEQREIVDRLDEAFSISMELIDLQQRQHEALRFMRESILRKAFAGEL